MLEDFLNQNSCFKLVCGAGNEDVSEIERLVYVYSLAGCTLFDISANIEVINAAKKGLVKSKITEDRYLCVSFGIKGDPHTKKAQINENLCTKCGACKKICPQNAILENGKVNYVKDKRCIGCNKCEKICKHNAITLKSIPIDIEKVMPAIIKEGIDCIEFHASINDENEVMNKWETINSLYKGLLSICIDRSNLGNKKFITRIKNMIKNRKPFSTIIQADGIPMSGGDDDYKTTLQAVAAAQIVKDEKLPVYLLISGGTNSKTKTLADMCEISPNGIAIGSYARKIVKDYISREDFFTNTKYQEEAVRIAKNLVDSSINN